MGERRAGANKLQVEPLFLTDAEIARRVSMSPEEWRAAAIVLEREGLPRCDPLFRNQRCWPSVRDFLYLRSRAGAEAPKAAIVENLNALRATGRRGTRP